MRLFFPLLLLFSQSLFAQTDTINYSKQRDVIDILQKIVSRQFIKRDTIKKRSGRLYFSGSPSVGYSLTSGWAGILVANGAFYTSEEREAKLSNVYSDLVYTQRQQLIFKIQSNIWTKGNKFNIVNDWRYYAYPLKTYGLGGNTSLNNAANQDYRYLRFYQTVLRTIGPNLYAGLGYAVDYHWNITGTSLTNPNGGDTAVIRNINLYGISDKSLSSGVMASLLYDNRLNSINPTRGTYANLIVRQNFSGVGDNAWQSLLVDVRQYVPFPRRSQNVLAFWSFNWLTVNGNPPYLDLPSTGWDTYSNVGRGYIQGRFRSKNLVYLEAEYRFKLTNDGLIGGVIFANAQSVTDWPSNQFKSVAPGSGFGIRLKFNKYSRTNIAIDYGFGMGGSNGIFVNLGEVF